jgi:hypothetical protein
MTLLCRDGDDEMDYICEDNRFEIIERYKNELISATNIESSPEEMTVLDNILFRFWQMGWLKEQEAVEPKQGEWIYCEDVSGQDGFKCSECGFFEPWYYSFENHNFITDYAYCPSCGKPMQEGR